MHRQYLRKQVIKNLIHLIQASIILKSNNDKYRFLNLFSFVFQASMRHVMTSGSLKNAIERNREENVGRRGLLKIAKRRVVFAQVTNDKIASK